MIWTFVCILLKNEGNRHDQELRKSKGKTYKQQWSLVMMKTKASETIPMQWNLVSQIIPSRQEIGKYNAQCIQVVLPCRLYKHKDLIFIYIHLTCIKLFRLSAVQDSSITIQLSEIIYDPNTYIPLDQAATEMIRYAAVHDDNGGASGEIDENT